MSIRLSALVLVAFALPAAGTEPYSIGPWWSGQASADPVVVSPVDPWVRPYDLGTREQHHRQVLGAGGPIVRLNSQDPNGACDNITGIEFTPDGQRVLVSAWSSRNVTVYDVATMAVIEVIDTGGSSNGLAISPDGQWACVVNLFEDTATIIALDDYSTTTVAVGDQPIEVAASPDNKFVTLNTLDANYSLIDPTVPSATVIGSKIDSAVTFSFTTIIGRRGFNGSNMVFTGDGQTVISAGPFEDLIYFTDVTTGQTDTLLTQDWPAGVAMAADGDTFVVSYQGFVEPTQNGVARFSASARQELDFLAVDGDVSNMPGVVVDSTGMRGAVSLLNDTAIFDFADRSVTILSGSPVDTNSFVEAYCQEPLCFLGDYPGSVVNIETGTLLTQTFLNSRATDFAGFGDLVVGVNANFTEAITWQRFDGAASHILLNEPAGEQPEADAPRLVGLSPGGAHAAFTNYLTANITLYDLDGHTVTDVVPVTDRPEDVAFTPDGERLLVTNRTSDMWWTAIIDLDDLSTTQVTTGASSSEILIDAAGTYAYVANAFNGTGSSDSMTRVDLDLEQPAGAIILSADIGYGLGAISETSQVTFTPDGESIVVLGSGNDIVSIVDVASFSQTTSFVVGPGPARIAYAPDGMHAYVTNSEFGADSVSVVKIDGILSTELTRLSLDEAFGDTTYLPMDIVVTADGKFVIVANRWVSTYGLAVMRVDTELSEWAFVQYLFLQNYPAGLVLSDDGERLYVVTDGDVNLHEFTIDTNNPVAPLAPGPSTPLGLAIGSIAVERHCDRIIGTGTGVDLFGTFRLQPTGDSDEDTDVDVADFATLQLCFSADDRAAPGCCVSDLGDDGFVDRTDHALLLENFGGP